MYLNKIYPSLMKSTNYVTHIIQKRLRKSKNILPKKMSLYHAQE
jgi:hypothetical protein